MDLSQLSTDEILDKLLLLVVVGGITLIILRDLLTVRRLWVERKKDTTRWTKSPLNPIAAGSAREYTYKGAAHVAVLLVEAAGVSSIIVCAFAAIVLIGLALQSYSYPTLDLIRCLLVCDLATGWFLGVGLINALPTVWVSNEGVAISVYFTGRVLIPWTELVDVRRFAILPGTYQVRARSITPLHQLYGWIGGTRLPSFMIHQSINGSDELVGEVRRRISRLQGEGNGGGR